MRSAHSIDADLIVLSVFDTFSRYFDWRLTVYRFAVLFSTTVRADIVVSHRGREYD